MHDGLVVGGRQSIRHLHGVFDDFALGQRAAIEDGAKAFPLEKLRNQEGGPHVLADVVDGENVGMIERGDGLRFLFETAKAIRIVIERFREDLQGDIASEPSVTSTSENFSPMPPAPNCE